MPEGHTVHRTANDFNSHFVGRVVGVDSPQGRFSAGASLLNGQQLQSATAVGKQLFLRFDSSQTLRIHLGIYGKWRWYFGSHAASALKAEVVGEVRARFWTADALADLRGPTVCEVLGDEEVAQVLRRLGPDPLNPDVDGAEFGRFAERVGRSKNAIGLLLMDQSVISGVGNVYRAELLFRAGIDPYTPGNLLPTEVLSKLWEDTVDLMRVGVKTGYMITRDELFEANPSKLDRNFVYKREGKPCRKCGQKVNLALAAGRKLYWCPGCQR